MVIEYAAFLCCKGNSVLRIKNAECFWLIMWYAFREERIP